MSKEERDAGKFERKRDEEDQRDGMDGERDTRGR